LKDGGGKTTSVCELDVAGGLKEAAMGPWPIWCPQVGLTGVYSRREVKASLLVGLPPNNDLAGPAGRR
jgi:hypothetical protein